jgi:hypothetical protein
MAEPEHSNPPRALMFQQRGYGRRLGHTTASLLQENGFQLAAVTIKGSTTAFTRTQTDVTYESVTDFDQIINDPYSVPGVDELTLTEVCDGLGIDSIWPIAQERMYSRNYGDKYYYSFKQNRSDEDIAAYVKAAYLTYVSLFDQFRPDIIVALSFVATFQMIAMLLAKQREIPMIGIEHSRVRGHFIISHDQFGESGPFIDRVVELHEKRDVSENIIGARQYIQKFREKFEHPAAYDLYFAGSGFAHRIKQELKPFKDILRFLGDRPKNDHPLVGATIDYRTPRIILRDHFSHKRQKRQALSFAYSSVPKDRSFAYMPMQVQPEHAIDVLAAYANNQIETARQVAQSLPGDMCLIVKEHPGMIGRRKKSFYEKLAKTVNVKLVHPMTEADELIRSATLMISAAGTSIVEAAFLKLPVIQLGRHGLTRHLPNVRLHSDISTITSAIIEHQNLFENSTEYEERLEQWVAAVLDSGFELDYEKALWGEGSDQFAQAYMSEIVRLIGHKLTIEKATS